MSATSKTQRWLDLIAFLVGRRLPVTYEQIAEAVPGYGRGLSTRRDAESVRKSFERDKSELRRLGVPLDTVEYRVDGMPTQGYRLLRRDFYLPYLRLLREAGEADREPPPPSSPPGVMSVEADELRVAAWGVHTLAELSTFPLRHEARSAFRKLTFDLEPVLGEPPPTYLASADPASARATVERLGQAVTRRKTVAFTYHGIARGQPSQRRVHPYGLLFKYGHWYLVGHDLDRGALRTFRVSRMEAPALAAPARSAPDYEIPADLDLGAWSRSEAWDLPGDDAPAERVVVRFEFPRSLWAERNRHGEPAEATAGDGSQLRAFRVRQQGPFLRWLLTLEGDAQVVEPAGTAERFRELARAVAALYGDTDG